MKKWWKRKMTRKRKRRGRKKRRRKRRKRKKKMMSMGCNQLSDRGMGYQAWWSPWLRVVRNCMADTDNDEALEDDPQEKGMKLQ